MAGGTILVALIVVPEGSVLVVWLDFDSSLGEESTPLLSPRVAEAAVLLPS